MRPDGRATFLRGVKEFNRARFFDAHETWETLWLKAIGRDKLFLQGTIQVAAAFHHWRRGNIKGTLSLLNAALGKLDSFSAGYRGIRVDRLRTAAGAWIEALSAIERPAPPALPRIEMESDEP